MQEIVESSKARRKTAAEAIEILTDAYQSPAYSEKTMDRIAEMKGIVSCLQAPFFFESKDCIVLAVPKCLVTKKGLPKCGQICTYQLQNNYWGKFSQ